MKNIKSSFDKNLLNKKEEETNRNEEINESTKNKQKINQDEIKKQKGNHINFISVPIDKDSYSNNTSYIDVENDDNESIYLKTNINEEKISRIEEEKEETNRNEEINESTKNKQKINQDEIKKMKEIINCNEDEINFIITILKKGFGEKYMDVFKEYIDLKKTNLEKKSNILIEIDDNGNINIFKKKGFINKQNILTLCNNLNDNINKFEEIKRELISNKKIDNSIQFPFDKIKKEQEKQDKIEKEQGDNLYEEITDISKKILEENKNNENFIDLDVDLIRKLNNYREKKSKNKQSSKIVANSQKNNEKIVSEEKKTTTTKKYDDIFNYRYNNYITNSDKNEYDYFIIPGMKNYRDALKKDIEVNKSKCIIGLQSDDNSNNHWFRYMYEKKTRKDNFEKIEKSKKNKKQNIKNQKNTITKQIIKEL